MASASQCHSTLGRLQLSSITRASTLSIPRFLLPSPSQRAYATGGENRGGKKEKPKKKHKTFRSYRDLKIQERYSLLDALRYLRAVEVGRPPSSIKYDIAVKLKTLKNGPVVKSRLRLPHPIGSNVRIAVLCKEGGTVAAGALEAGAVMVGEQSLLAAIKAGDMPFDKLLCHDDSVKALQEAGLARILGPKGMMPNSKNRTITSNIVGMMREMVGAEEYREKMGVVRMGIGQLNFTPEMLSANISAVMSAIKRDLSKIDEHFTKDVEEVVLSTTNGPGFSLDGGFKSADEKLTPEMLSTAV